MGRVESKRAQAARRKHRASSRINQGVVKHPVLIVRVSNKHVHAQIKKPEDSKVVASATSDLKTSKAKNMTEKATFVGQEIAKHAKKHKISKVTLDRGSKLYHGRISAFTDAVREAGVEV